MTDQFCRHADFLLPGRPFNISQFTQPVRLDNPLAKVLIGNQLFKVVGDVRLIACHDFLPAVNS